MLRSGRPINIVPKNKKRIISDFSFRLYRPLVQPAIIFVPRNPAQLPEQSTRLEEVASIPRKIEKYSSLTISNL